MKDSIAILLSTYNGEKYLEQQINSILNQDYANWKLFIRDDGSKDSTKEIIKQYCRNYDNIYFIEDDCNRGAALSFLYLLNLIESDYYMFCDQDDIWFNNKVTILFNELKNNLDNNEKPVLVFSDAQVVNQNLEIIANSFWKYNKFTPDLILRHKSYITVFNCAPGCTMIFNKVVKKYLNDIDETILMHDWYLMIKVLKYGVVSYVNQALMLYRQHENNVVGASEVSFFNQVLKITRIKKYLSSQIKTFKFVNRYTGISIFQYYKHKLKFNVLRFRNRL